MTERYLSKAIEAHLKSHRQMVFLTGPRQVGKTTLAQSFLPAILPAENYFNWDVAEHRRILSTQIFTGKEPLGKEKGIVVFDEIHKYPRWKNTLKGLFDTHEPETHWIVTGSAKLDVYRRGQDSLLGRYFTYSLHPFSVIELTHSAKQPLLLSQLLEYEFPPASLESEEALQTLKQFSGFPEPLFKQDSSFLLRWRTSRLERLINQDLAGTETLKNLPLVEQLMFLLPERVGSPLSLNSLREDLEVHFATVKHWMELLERVFYGFFLQPYSKKLSRMLKKEAKWYLWDWTEIQEPGTRFENLTAVHLLKYVHYMNQLGLDRLSLHYVRDKEKREVDFLICQNRKPKLLIECKLKLQDPSEGLHHFAALLGVPAAIQLHETGECPRRIRSKNFVIHSLPASALFEALV